MSGRLAIHRATKTTATVTFVAMQKQIALYAHEQFMSAKQLEGKALYCGSQDYMHVHIHYICTQGTF